MTGTTGSAASVRCPVEKSSNRRHRARKPARRRGQRSRVLPAGQQAIGRCHKARQMPVDRLMIRLQQVKPLRQLRFGQHQLREELRVRDLVVAC